MQIHAEKSILIGKENSINVYYGLLVETKFAGSLAILGNVRARTPEAAVFESHKADSAGRPPRLHKLPEIHHKFHES